MCPPDEPTAELPDPFAGWRYGAPEPPVEPAAQTPAAATEQPRVPRERPSRRVAALVGAGTLAALAGVLALTQGGGGGPLAPASTPVTRAAYVTGLEPGYKVALNIDETVAGHALSFTAHGAFSTGAHPQGSMTMLAPGGLSINEIVVGPDLFMQLPGAAGAALAPTPWVKAKLAAVTGGSFNFSTTGDSDPSQQLDLLRSAGQVTAVGAETVRGVATTRYHAVIDLNRYPSVVAPSLRAAAASSAAILERATGQSTLAADVWVDRNGLVRRMTLDLRACSWAGTIDATVSMDIYDFGRQPAVAPPPPSEVTDITSTLAAQIAKSTQQLGC
jgi:hypothetical protein